MRILLRSKINEIILKELENKEIETGYVYNMFRLYEYGTTIIICFETKKIEDSEENYYSRWNGETEKNCYIEWDGNIKNLIKEINEIKFYGK